MPDNRPFSEEQDNIIKNLFEKQKITKWAIIARKLTEEHNMPRNAKQCRDRYQQYLDPMIQSEWTQKQEKKLFRLHDQIGNKWALIAMQFPGKTDNIVKNHFYSKLRKSMRKLNKIISKNFKRQFKELKIGVIYKIVEGFEEQFKQKPVIDSDVSEHCKDLKNQLLEYSNNNEEMVDENYSQERALLKQINEFNKIYKKKSKKERRSSINTSELFKVPEKRLKTVSDYQQSSSEFSFPISHDYNASDENASEKQQSPKLLVVIQQQEIRQSQNSKISINLGKEEMMSEKMSEDKPNSVEELLRGSGALQMGKFSQNIFNADSSRRSASNKSQFQKINMFDDVRFSGGMKSMQMQEEYDEIRFSGGLRSSNKFQEEKEREDLYRSHR